MNLRSFLKDKIPAIILLLAGLFTIEIFLLAYQFTFLTFYIPIIILALYFIGLGLEYFIKQKFYKNLEKSLDSLEKKYLLSELLETPTFIEGKILKDVLRQTGKSMLEYVNYYKHAEESYEEYIELWIHEIKIPIATGKLIVENHKNQTTKSIAEELDKIEDYTEQALYYAHSNTVEKDYYIKKVTLSELVSSSIKKNKNLLIRHKATIHTHDLEKIVYTDSKWLVFILGQLISNSIKYQKLDKKLEIKIYAKGAKENITLFYKDNGLGISESDLPRVFEKGFTGENGRLSGKKSTGIGLYLCEKLCHKLGISIELNSKQRQGCEVKLIFPKNSYLTQIK